MIGGIGDEVNFRRAVAAMDVVQGHARSGAAELEVRPDAVIQQHLAGGFSPDDAAFAKGMFGSWRCRWCRPKVRGPARPLRDRIGDNFPGWWRRRGAGR